MKDPDMENLIKGMELAVCGQQKVHLWFQISSYNKWAQSASVIIQEIRNYPTSYTFPSGAIALIQGSEL